MPQWQKANQYNLTATAKAANQPYAGFGRLWQPMASIIITCENYHGNI